MNNITSSLNPLSVNDSTGRYSPITLSHEWPRIMRLLIMVICSVVGTVLNGFFVAAFFFDKSLRRLGNVYLACSGLTDLLITGVVLPVSAMVLLSGQWESVEVCHALQFLTESANYAFSLYFIFVSAESYFRLCRSTNKYKKFLSIDVKTVTVLISLISFTVGGVGVYLRLDYDYCERGHLGNIFFRTSSFIVLYAVPFLIIGLGLVYSLLLTRRRAKRQQSYRDSQQFEHDLCAVYLNMASYVLFVGCWAPYLTICHDSPPSDNAKFYHRIWLGVFRSVISNVLCLILNSQFRHAFSRIFFYCCCKSTVNGSVTRRRRGQHRSGDIRVHIMHQGTRRSTNSPQRLASGVHETQDL